MQMQDIKRKIKQNAPAFMAGLGTGLTVVVYMVLKQNAAEAKMTEPARFSGNNTNIVVLENVEKNIWHDMDEPDSYYKLVGMGNKEYAYSHV